MNYDKKIEEVNSMLEGAEGALMESLLRLRSIFETGKDMERQFQDLLDHWNSLDD